MSESEKDRIKGTRYDDTLTVEGESDYAIDAEGRLYRTGENQAQQVSSAGDDVLVERSQNHELKNPCDKFGHRASADGSACRFCGAPL